jgi:hypothetical protein
MKTATLLSSISLLFAATVTAQTACDPVASAIPTCGVRQLFLLSLLTRTSPPHLHTQRPPHSSPLGSTQ